MTDDEKPGKVDQLLKQLALGRVAFGAATLLAPRLATKSIGLGGGPDGGRDYLARAFGAREIALGAGYLLAKGPARRTWARLGLVVDGLDTLSAVKSRGVVPFRVTAAGAVVSAGAAAVGAAALAGDIIGR